MTLVPTGSSNPLPTSPTRAAKKFRDAQHSANGREKGEAQRIANGRKGKTASTKSERKTPTAQKGKKSLMLDSQKKNR